MVVVAIEAGRNRDRAMSFDGLAPGYRAAEAVLAGGLLQRCRTRFLDRAEGCRRALLLGEGPGRFLEALLHGNPRVQVVCVEQSAAMIGVARRQLARIGVDGGRVRFQQRDVLSGLDDLRPDGGFDLVATHFFLDCFRPDEVRRVVEGVARVVDEAGCGWLLTDFREPESGWRRWRARLYLAVMYGVFRRLTRISARRIAPPDACLRAVGFRLAARELASGGLIQSDFWRRG